MMTTLQFLTLHKDCKFISSFSFGAEQRDSSKVKFEKKKSGNSKEAEWAALLLMGKQNKTKF